MKTKKASAEWYTAATHWLTSLIMATILGVVLFILIIIVGGDNQIAILLANVIVLPITMYLAVKYSAGYVNKTYIITKADMIVNYSTIYTLIIAGGYRVYTFLKTGIFTYEYVGFIIAFVVFYVASKKYIKNNSNQTV
jgi:hypothetical protein